MEHEGCWWVWWCSCGVEVQMWEEKGKRIEKKKWLVDRTFLVQLLLWSCCLMDAWCMPEISINVCGWISVLCPAFHFFLYGKPVRFLFTVWNSLGSVPISFLISTTMALLLESGQRMIIHMINDVLGECSFGLLLLLLFVVFFSLESSRIITSCFYLPSPREGRSWRAPSLRMHVVNEFEYANHVPIVNLPSTHSMTHPNFLV